MANNTGRFTGLELNYQELPLETRFRFAEYEISKAIGILVLFTPHPHAKVQAAENIFKLIAPGHTEEALDEWVEVFMSAGQHRLTRLSKAEEAAYFLYRNVSYTNIRKLTGLSPNTIAKYRFHNPYSYTKYGKWDEFMLERWDRIKGGLNIWNQPLFHTEV